MIDPLSLGAEKVEEYINRSNADTNSYSSSSSSTSSSSCSSSSSSSSEGNNNNSGEFEVNEDLLAQLASMGVNDFIAKKALKSTKNAAIEEVFEYIMTNETTLEKEAKEEVERVRNTTKDVKIKKSSKPRLIPLELQKLFTNMQSLNLKALTTSDLTSKGFKWTNFEGQVQHDAHELNRLLIDALERSLKHTAGESLCQSLYQGLLVNQTKCMGCSLASERQENYYDILLQVKGHTDLVSSLRDYTAAEILTGDNKYACDNSSQCIGTRQEAHRSVILRSVPPILTFSCQRFDLDYTTWQRVKLTSKFEFPLALNIDNFVESADGSPKPRLSGEEETKYLHDLRNTCGIWIDDVYEIALGVAEDMLKSSSSGDVASIMDNITAMSNTDEEYLDIKRKILRKICKNGVQSEENLYELFAIIMHRGTAYSGHYFAYIKDQTDQGRWEGPSFPLAEKLASSNKGNNEKDYVMHIFDDQCNDLTVQADSPLHVLIELLQDEKGKCSNIGKLGGAVRKKTGATWNAGYAKKYGKINEFLQRFSPEVFELDGNTASLAANRNINVRSSSEFSSILALKNGKDIEDEQNSNDVDPKELLADMLIQRCFGCFYEFNDSHVKPMSIPETKRAFEGKDSAYLLVYRKSFGINCVTKSRSVPEMPPPRFWMQKAEEINQQLSKQRYF